MSKKQVTILKKKKKSFNKQKINIIILNRIPVNDKSYKYIFQYEYIYITRSDDDGNGDDDKKNTYVG